jgi:GAF domain-containing protein
VPDIEQLYAGRPIVFPDGRQLLGQDPKFDVLLEALEPLDWQACMYVFMTWRGTVVGDVAAYFPTGVPGPTEAEMSFLAGLADHAAVAVANTRLLDQASELRPWKSGHAWPGNCTILSARPCSR